MTPSLASENVNALWASFTVETLVRLGLTAAVISPGSRSAPLAWAFARHPGVRSIPVLDERSAGFLALGMAKQRGNPVALVCTSGTAAANYLPAVIEAKEGRVPLLVLTADRPPELRECSSGQAIDQVKLFGHYPKWQVEIALPESGVSRLRYLRQTLGYAWRRSLQPVGGPVHLNFPFREPLAPVEDGSVASEAAAAAERLLSDVISFPRIQEQGSLSGIAPLQGAYKKARKGLIVAGGGLPQMEETARAVADLVTMSGWPLLADVLSGLRDYSDLISNVVGHYDALLASGWQPPTPDFILQIGALPTSKRLRQWIEAQDLPTFVVDPGEEDLDPLRSRSVAIPIDVKRLPAFLKQISPPGEPVSGSTEQWLMEEKAISERIAGELEAETTLFEGKVAWELARAVPPGEVLFFASSMPVRDAEFFWPAGSGRRRFFANRGANGIDGTFSTALGLAMEEGQSITAVVGDLAFLHDTNGLLNWRRARGSLTVILINNDGGGIFENLPIASFDPPFEEFFATPQAVNMERLCSAYDIPFERLRSWERLRESITASAGPGVRVLEIVTDRKKDSLTRRRILSGSDSRSS